MADDPKDIKRKRDKLIEDKKKQKKQRGE